MGFFHFFKSKNSNEGVASTSFRHKFSIVESSWGNRPKYSIFDDDGKEKYVLKTKGTRQSPCLVLYSIDGDKICYVKSHNGFLSGWVYKIYYQNNHIEDVKREQSVDEVFQIKNLNWFICRKLFQLSYLVTDQLSQTVCRIRDNQIEYNSSENEVWYLIIFMIIKSIDLSRNIDIKNTEV